MLREDPRQRHLARRGIALVCYGLDFLHYFEILCKVRLGKPRQELPSVVLIEIRGRMISTKIQDTKSTMSIKGFRINPKVRKHTCR